MTSIKRLEKVVEYAQKALKLHQRKRKSWQATLDKHNKNLGFQISQINKNFKNNAKVRNMVLAYIRMDGEKYAMKYQRKIDYHQSRIDLLKERIARVGQQIDEIIYLSDGHKP